MKVIGHFKCEHCHRILTRNLLAAYGLEEARFSCPTCGSAYTYEVKQGEGEGEREFVVHKDAGFQLVVIALLGNPHDDRQGFMPVPLTIPLLEPLQMGLSPLDVFHSYLALMESAFEALLVSKYTTVYGVGTMPRLMAVIPEDMYRRLGHPKTIRFFDKLRDASKYLSQWVETCVKKNNTGLTMSAGASIAFSLIPTAPYIANFVDALLGEKISIVYEEGVVVGVNYNGSTLMMRNITLPGKTTYELAEMVATDHQDYLNKLRANIQEGKKKK